VLGIVNSEIVKVTDESVQNEIDINTEVLLLTIPNTSVLISISFCTLSSVTFIISLLSIPNTSVLIAISFCTFSFTEVLGIVNSEIVKVTDESVQNEIDINTEVLEIVNSEIVKVTNESVQKEIDINTEVLGIVNGEIVKVTNENVQKEIAIYFFLNTLISYFYYFTINYP
jgi:hypothetical protein